MLMRRADTHTHDITWFWFRCYKILEKAKSSWQKIDLGLPGAGGQGEAYLLQGREILGVIEMILWLHNYTYLSKVIKFTLKFYFVLFIYFSNADAKKKKKV